MQRTKVFAVAAALVSAAIAAVMLTGGATAASWHVYQGDMFAGHAYGLQVPAGAESIEFSYDGPDGGAASIGVYAPGGARVGHYALTPDLAKASVANPEPGQYAVYVYEITEGALAVRVASEDEPALELTSIPLARDETKIGTFEQGALDQVITTELAREPVFVTLLYEGSSRGLDATVASEKGDVVTIVDESATAFSPGVWTTLSGERAFEAANLEGALYTVTVHADAFEGTMVLTTLALEIPRAPTPTVGSPVAPAPPAPPAVPTHDHSHAVGIPAAAFALTVGDAVAFDAPAGMLQVLDPGLLGCEANGHEHQESYEEDAHESCGSHATIALYAPDDSLLTIVDLSHDAASAEVELPVAGEYVAFTHHASGDLVLASLLGSASVPVVRVLELGEEVHQVDAQLLLGGQSTEVTLENVPLFLDLTFRDGLGALASARLENEKGIVASTDGAMLGTPASFGSYVDPYLFAKGLHILSVDGAVFEGSVQVLSLHYLRDSEVVEPPQEEHTHGDHEAEGEAEEDAEADEEAEDEGSPILGPLLGPLVLPEMPW